MGARAQSETAEIVLFSGETGLPYERPPLSKEILVNGGGGLKPIVPGSLIKERGIDLRMGEVVERLDASSKTVELKGGGSYRFDRAVIATGACPQELPLLPRNIPAVHYLRTIDDAIKLRQRLSATLQVIVIGAGWIGLEVAAAARTLGRRVIVIEAVDRILHRTCDPVTAERIRAIHAKNGVSFHLGRTVVDFSQSDENMSLELDDGTQLDATDVVVGVGISPNIGLAAGAGLHLSDGIMVNQFGETSNSGIYAAGDVARLPLPWIGGNHCRLETWSHAQDHGRVVGMNAAGGKHAYRSVPYFWSDQYDHRIQGIGTISKGAVPQAIRKRDGARCAFFLNLENQIEGALGIDAEAEISAVRKLIERGISVDLADLCDASVSLPKLAKRPMKRGNL